MQMDADYADFQTRRRSLSLLTTRLLATLLLLPAAAFSAPVPEAERIALDLRRTTLVVRDVERSLELYRDALGMRVSYDNLIRTPRTAATDDEAERSLRLVFMQANDDFVGVLGLMEYRKPRKSQPVSDLAFEPGTSVLVFNVNDLDQRWDAVTSVPGVEVIDPPSETSYPSYDGRSTITVMVSVIRDPDGFILELNQLMSELR
jgi:catechol 2,3-dioxygenase-like lactoylglutathione lyase family enzyme